MTIKEILIAARKLIEQPEHFTRNSYAKDVHGGSVWWDSPDIHARCAAGAIYAVVGSPLAATDVMLDLDRAARRQPIPNDVAYRPQRDPDVLYVNDALGHAAVLKMFDDAIEAAA